METRTITKRNGNTYTVLLDDADAAYYDQHTWHVTSHGYAARSPNRGEKEYLHRVIARAPSTMEVDHRDDNRLNNTRDNLRVCTSAQNNANSVRGNRASGYIGVQYNRRYARKRQATVGSGSHGRRKEYVGYFDSPEEAARARDRAARERYGEFAVLNFPDEVALAN